MLMKTKNGRFRISGAGCQGPAPAMSWGTEFRVPASASAITDKLNENWRRNISKNEGSSGDIDENKERQDSGVGRQVSGADTYGCRGRTDFRLPASAGAVTDKLHQHLRGTISKNEGSSGDVDENKEGAN